MFKIDLKVFKLNFNETIVEIKMLELRNNSYSSLWFFPNFAILNLFRRTHFRVWNPNSKVYNFTFLE
jgi:hypothetical protein